MSRLSTGTNRLRVSVHWLQQHFLSMIAAPAALIVGVSSTVYYWTTARGALTAERRAAKDEYQAAFAAYRQTVLNAFSQVAANLQVLGTDAGSLHTQQRALDSASARSLSPNKPMRPATPDTCRCWMRSGCISRHSSGRCRRTVNAMLML
jgi:hypothetical protein